jgi:uncharacterized protein with GYD domain
LTRSAADAHSLVAGTGGVRPSTKQARDEYRGSSATGEETMPLYMYQAAYTPESWAAQLKNPQNRADTVGRAICEAAGGQCLGAWYSFGEYDLMIIAEMPNAESMAAVALAVAAGGAVKSATTTVLMSGAEGVAAMQKAASVANSYKPAR